MRVEKKLLRLFLRLLKKPEKTLKKEIAQKATLIFWNTLKSLMISNQLLETFLDFHSQQQYQHKIPLRLIMGLNLKCSNLLQSPGKMR
jgi:hypothetical protein